MKRLTYYENGHARYDFAGAQYQNKIADRLAAYEDTGLEPEEITDYLPMMKEWRQNIGALIHVHELVKIESENRLLILPCKVGDKAFWVPDMKKDDWIVEDTVGGFIVEGNNRIRLMLPGLCMEPIYPQTHLFLTREEAEAALRGGADG